MYDDDDFADNADDMWVEAADEHMREVFAGDPGGCICFLLDGVPESKLPKALEEIREYLPWYDTGLGFKVPRRAFLMLKELYEAQEPLTGVKLEAGTGITRKTVGIYLKRFEKLGLIQFHGSRGGAPRLRVDGTDRRA